MRVAAFARVPIAAAIITATAATGSVAAATVDDDPPPTRPPVTVNEFMPEDRALGDCISAIPKPGCGSEARGGWRQGLVLLVILGGLGLIAWRVVVSARRARSEASEPA